MKRLFSFAVVLVFLLTLSSPFANAEAQVQYNLGN